MKKSSVIKLLPMLILIGGFLILSGCGEKDSCEGGQRQLPAKWVEAKFPLIQGGSICTYNGDKDANIKYKNMETFELYDKYAEKFKSEGWKLSMEKDRGFFAAEKNGKKFTVGFLDCSRPWSKCAYADVSIMGDR